MTQPLRAPKGLKTRGARLWKESTALGDFDPAGLVLLEEACRIADRLDALAAVLDGDQDAWFTLREQKGDGDALEIVIDSALSEARQHAMALKNISNELRQIQKLRAKTAPAQPKGAADVPKLGDLTARIAERRTATSA